MPRKPPVGKSLAEVNPALAKEWHPTKNGDLTPMDVFPKSSVIVWWKCSKGDDHEWKVSVHSRKGCPVCENKKVVLSNCLATTHPEIAKEWHRTKNGELTPFDIVAGSNKKFWWKCPKGDDHEWVASSNKRLGGAGCHICWGRKVVKSNCLATTHEQISTEWHPTKNGDLTPNDVSIESNKKVWWKCSKGKNHEWLAQINSRKVSNCPVCGNKKVVISNCLATTHPEIAEEWHPAKNGELTPFDIVAGSNKKVWWKCSKGDDHEWETAINIRKIGRNCPICANRKLVKSNSFGMTHPDIAAEWHPTKNGGLTPYDFFSGTNKKVWWKCPTGDDHVYQSSIAKRANGQKCRICSGRKLVYSNSLGFKFPKLINEWDFKKNANTPFDYIYTSRQKVWWKCPKEDDHEWCSAIYPRTKGIGCPYCSSQALCITNSLAYVYPNIAKEWHPTKNGKLKPKNVISGGLKKYWWKCPKGDDHEWYISIAKRVYRGHNCPVCSGQKVVNSNCLETLNPSLASQWHPSKNKSLTPKDFTVNSGKKVWWQCEKGEDHFWQATIDSRNSRNLGCPFCTLTPQSRQELTITFELLKIFKEIDPKGFKIRIDGKIWSIDIYIPKIHIGIEFDGSYWHKDKAQLDKLKTEKIEETGLNLIRVRQKPLKRLFEDDVIAEKKFDGKQITNDILKQIVKDNGKYSYTLDKRTLNKIDNYLSREGLQNEKGLDKYIDQILTEKAERKK